MKFVFLFACFGAVLTLSGCGSDASNTGLPPQDRQQQLKANTSIPAPAQQLADEQIANKKQMDDMRAKDAANAPAAP